MNEYRPDEWVMIKIVSKEYGTIYKIFAGWQGGYASGDSWKLSSGCLSVKKEVVKKMSGSYEQLVCPQSSGSTYYTHYIAKGNDFERSYYGVAGWRYSVLSGILDQLNAMPDVSAEIMPAGTDFEALDYSVAGTKVATN
jgi:hypothetical protein